MVKTNATLEGANALTGLSPGVAARIRSFSNPTLSGKFMAMGILPGASIQLVRKAPFSGAFYVRVGDSYFALRTEEAASIIVHG